MSEASPASAGDRLQSVRALEDQYLFPTYARQPILLERGKGVWIYDHAGKRYLDCITGIGVAAMGHAHPRILAAMRDQGRKLIHSSNLYYNEYQGELARRLCGLSGMERGFITVSGTEAMEGALKVARALGRRYDSEKTDLVALTHSFHGRTLGSLSITGTEKYRAPFEPLLPGVTFVTPGDEAALQAAVGPRTCAVIVEAVQGEGGVRPLPESFLATAAGLARQHQASLVCDEIQCGLGRTGGYFAFQATGLQPDIVTVAKPIAGGFPLGAVLARGEAATALSSGLHGTTFGGGPLGCRLALEFLDFLEAPGRLEHIRAMGDRLLTGLQQIAERRRFVREARGRGLMAALELDRPAKSYVTRMAELGLLANVTHDTIIRLLPPYVIEPAEVDRALRIVDRTLAQRDLAPQNP